MIKIKKGLDIPIKGEPEQDIDGYLSSKYFGYLGTEFIGIKPVLKVKVGDKVNQGDILFIDKKIPELKFISPFSGTVDSINRGYQRSLESVVVKKDDSQNSIVQIPNHSITSIHKYEKSELIKILLDTSLWLGLRTRPFSRVTNPNDTIDIIFVNAIDTNPLSPKPSIIINKYEKEFLIGLEVVSQICSEKIFLCKDTDIIPCPKNEKIKEEIFDGPHPAGLVGTHIHFLYGADLNHPVSHINYQDVISIGYLFLHGHLLTKKIISIAGPTVIKPALYEVDIGSGLDILDQVQNNIYKNPKLRIISGSILNGIKMESIKSNLGKYHLQLSILEEGNQKEFLGWIKPGKNKFSVTKAFTSQFFKNKRFNINTSMNGSKRSMVPIGNYEKIMPLDIEPTLFLRYLHAEDIDNLLKIGILELDEEDLGLCNFVCPGKANFNKKLRHCLDIIYKEV
ncbi:NADH:ubiquinone reductase (Na(+)-transporting) subunit A [Paraphotobacterium marinum]|uniref:Na(+)-translocating NADH-quinone reductase subunit A n=1 Tax=Paraphotobacterium marinum TaxID=1755811 RepID=A0A220VE83_9GAMM|nr:Na(+)-translocating NADH-quinone reductase subunit A [Paraphotobacterium marinum]ASK78472.1 NADH:ubiquinone reductase (Na(+)-transporting) subunit A [Paraphotobacterium marinum]